MSSLPAVAILNNSEDTVEMLRQCLQQHGFTSLVTGHVPDVKRGTLDIVEFVKTHDPRVFVWDVALPYDENWRFVHMLMGHQMMQGRRFVLTTTNKSALDSMVGPSDTIEIIGKPYDLERIVSAVRAAAGLPVAGER